MLVRKSLEAGTNPTSGWKIIYGKAMTKKADTPYGKPATKLGGNRQLCKSLNYKNLDTPPPTWL